MPVDRANKQLKRAVTVTLICGDVALGRNGVTQEHVAQVWKGFPELSDKAGLLPLGLPLWRINDKLLPKSKSDLDRILASHGMHVVEPEKKKARKEEEKPGDDGPKLRPNQKFVYINFRQLLRSAGIAASEKTRLDSLEACCNAVFTASAVCCCACSC